MSTNRRAEYKIKDRKGSHIVCLQTNRVNECYRYEGDKITDCTHLKLISIMETKWEDRITTSEGKMISEGNHETHEVIKNKGYTFIFSLFNDEKLLEEMGDCYILNISTAPKHMPNTRKFSPNERSAANLDIFKDFPNFYKLLTQYNPTYMDLYVYYSTPKTVGNLFDKIENPVFGDLYSIEELLCKSIWGLLLAGLRNEYYKNNPNATASDLYGDDLEKHRIAFRRNYYTDIPTVTDFDLYTCGYYSEMAFNTIERSYSRVDNILAKLPFIVAMALNFNNSVDALIPELEGDVWREMMLILKTISPVEDNNYDVTPSSLYKLYNSKLDRLESEEDYYKAITKQLTKYIYSKPLKSERTRLVYTVNETNEKTLKWRIDGESPRNIVKPHDILAKGDKYLYYYDIDTKDYLKTIGHRQINNVDEEIIKSFDIEAYKETMREEYSLIPEIKQYRKEEGKTCAFLSLGGCVACYRSLEADNKRRPECLEAGTMVVFSDYEVGFRLDSEPVTELVASNREVVTYHNFLSVTGGIFRSLLPNARHINSKSHESHTSIICNITEGQYNDPKFRDKYPKLAAMYNKMSKVYHGYLAHGERNPLAK